MAVAAQPLTPATLDEMGALAAWPPASEASGPDEEKVQTYRIWTCHGYTDSGNENRGFLRIERSRGNANGSFPLAIEQQVVHTGGILHQLKAAVVCGDDPLFSPREWTLTSRFFKPDGSPREDLSLLQRGQCWDGRLVSTTNGVTRRVNCAPRVTSDWCLMEAIRRMPREMGQPIEFDMLQGLTTLRPGHRLDYSGTETVARDGRPVTLHRFRQLGRGTLPYEYWLDERRRLVLVVTHTRAYVLDPTAETVVQRIVEAARRKGGKK
jgi:hypothetical protein